MNGLLTERDLDCLTTVWTFQFLTRGQIQRLCYPTDSSGRITRRRLQLLVELSLINRFKSFIYNPAAGPAAPTYYMAKKGLEMLAEFHRDDTFLLGCTRPPQAHHIFHWIAVSETHITFAQATQQGDIHLLGWINEWQVVREDATAPHE